MVRQALWRLDSGSRSDPDLLLGAARQVAYSYTLALAEHFSTADRTPSEAIASGLGVTEDLVAAERLARAAWEATRRFDAGSVSARSSRGSSATRRPRQP